MQLFAQQLEEMEQKLSDSMQETIAQHHKYLESE